MRHIAVILVCFSTFLTACATPSPRYTNSDFKTANKYCFDQAEADKRARVPNWFSRWVSCSQERVMPIEMYAFPGKEDAVKKIYERMLVLAPDVDSGRLRVETVYAESDNMKKDLLKTNCALKIVKADGGDHCVTYTTERRSPIR